MNDMYFDAQVDKQLPNVKETDITDRMNRWDQIQ
jgi:hypothetical protein